jgi:hypothetical protein
MAGYKQNKDFAETILPQYLLDEAIDWINKNMEPEDVFSDEQLKLWALNSGFTEGE